MTEFDEFNLSYDDNNVPLLSHVNIDDIVIDILGKYEPHLLVTPKAIDIDHFVEYYVKCDLDITYLSNNMCYLGMSIHTEGNTIKTYNLDNNSIRYIRPKPRTILIDARLYEVSELNRRRFTLAHESGHILLHQKYYELCPKPLEDEDIVSGVAALKSNQEISTELKTPIQWIEWQANAFAASLLMNKLAVEKLILNHGFDIRNLDIVETIEVLYLITQTFVVSFEAAEIRLKNIIKTYYS